MKRLRFFRHWNKWVTLGGLLLAGLLFFSAILLFSLFFASINRQAEEYNPITIIPVFTHTPTQPVPIASPTQTPSSVEVEGIHTGLYVQIIGTGGSGLRIRSSPGLNTEIKFYGMDSEAFLVKDGPVEQDGYLWWYLVAPYDESRSGWAASEFLELVVLQP